MLQLTNSLTKQKTLLSPLVANKISLYVCGVTVYDYCHIGHGRTYVAFDLLYRHLLAQGYEVTYVRNITDVDDKIIKRAQKNQESCQALTERFIQEMHQDYAALNILEPHYEPKATETMAEMIEMISQLLTKKYAYIASNGDIYYDTTRLDDYGALAQQDLDSLQAGARIQKNEAKRHVLDFVLWKMAKSDEPAWPSPWGEGRPGWHIECSAMSSKFLGKTIDIHGGGNDLKFPHHENERAQSEACYGQTFVNHWMHTGFVQVDEQKMSKSLNNFFTIREVLEKYDAESVRYFLLASHYRRPVSFNEGSIGQAHASLTTLYTALRGLSLEKVTPVENHPAQAAYFAAMDDDLNAPQALSVLFDLARQINAERAAGNQDQAVLLAAVLKKLAGYLGILQNDPDLFLQAGLDKKQIVKIEALIKQRQQARANKNWIEADAVRAQLDSMGVVVEDAAAGCQWRYGSSPTQE